MSDSRPVGTGGEDAGVVEPWEPGDPWPSGAGVYLGTEELHPDDPDLILAKYAFCMECDPHGATPLAVDVLDHERDVHGRDWEIERPAWWTEQGLPEQCPGGHTWGPPPNTGGERPRKTGPSRVLRSWTPSGCACGAGLGGHEAMACAWRGCDWHWYAAPHGGHGAWTWGSVVDAPWRGSDHAPG